MSTILSVLFPPRGLLRARPECQGGECLGEAPDEVLGDVALPLDQRVHQDRADRRGETLTAILVLEKGDNSVG